MGTWLRLYKKLNNLVQKTGTKNINNTGPTKFVDGGLRGLNIHFAADDGYPSLCQCPATAFPLDVLLSTQQYYIFSIAHAKAKKI
jgi:hypothetical protein